MHYVFNFCHAANALTDLSKLPKIPSLGKLKAKIKQLNSSFDIFDTPEDTLSAQQSLKGKLAEQLAQLLEEDPQDAAFRFAFIVPLGAWRVIGIGCLCICTICHIPGHLIYVMLYICLQDLQEDSSQADSGWNKHRKEDPLYGEHWHCWTTYPLLGSVDGNAIPSHV